MIRGDGGRARHKATDTILQMICRNISEGQGKNIPPDAKKGYSYRLQDVCLPVLVLLTQSTVTPKGGSIWKFALCCTSRFLFYYFLSILQKPSNKPEVLDLRGGGWLWRWIWPLESSLDNFGKPFKYSISGWDLEMLKICASASFLSLHWHQHLIIVLGCSSNLTPSHKWSDISAILASTKIGVPNQKEDMFVALLRSS